MNRKSEQILIEYLVLGAQRGESNSIAQLVRIWQTRFLAFAFRITRDRDQAADVVQDAWIAIIKGLKKLDDPAKFKSWSFRIVYHKSHDAIRQQIQIRKHRQQSAQERPSLRQPLETEGQTEQLRILNESISRLGDQDQLILNLFYQQELSIQEIGEILPLSNSAIKSRLFQARKKLKKVLERSVSDVERQDR